MDTVPPITDDEIVLRHVPGGTTWQVPGPRLTSANFRPRTHRDEFTISINRLRFTTPERLIELVGGNVATGSRVAWATAGAIRALGFHVEPKPIPPHDLGHAEIESTDAASLESNLGPKHLAALFQFADRIPIPDQGSSDTPPTPS